MSDILPKIKFLMMFIVVNLIIQFAFLFANMYYTNNAPSGLLTDTARTLLVMQAIGGSLLPAVSIPTALIMPFPVSIIFAVYDILMTAVLAFIYYALIISLLPLFDI